MIAISPFTVNDSTLKSSTVAEPDILGGESDWIKRGNVIITDHEMYRFDYDSENRKFYNAESTGDVVYIYNESFVYTGVSFSTATETSGINGIVVANDHVYVLSGNNYRIYEYTLDGVYTTVNFRVPHSNARFPRCLGTDGHKLIIAYDTGVGGETITFQSFSGSILYPFGMDLGVNTTISGIEISSRGLYLVDTDTTTGTKRILDVDITLSTDAGLISTPAIGSPAVENDFVAFGDVFYSGGAGTRVNQMLSDSTPANGHPSGSIVIQSFNHSKYISATLNQDEPYRGALKDAPTWTLYGPSNRYGMFDIEIASPTISASPLVVEFESGTVLNGIAGFGIYGANTINITMTDPVAGVVYDRDVEMQDFSNITNLYNWHFEPLSFINEFVLIDLPPYVHAVTKVTITGAGDIEVGALVPGKQIDLGIAEYGTSVQLLDFSRRERNTFGQFEIQKRNTAKLVNFDIKVPENQAGYLFRQFQLLSQVPAVFTGTEKLEDPTLVYGYYEGFTENFSTPIFTDITLTIQGVI